MDLVRCKNCRHRVDKTSKKHYSVGHGLTDRCTKCACNKPDLAHPTGREAGQVLEKHYPALLSGKM